jgi:hypothetical protein
VAGRLTTHRPMRCKVIVMICVLLPGLRIIAQPTWTMQPGVLVGGYKDLPAEFPGGMEALYKYMNEKLKSKVFLVEDEIKAVRPAMARFTVMTDGHVDSVKIIESSNIPRVDNIFIGVLKKMPKWKPARSRNKPIPQEFSFPLIIEVDPAKIGP